ncbi:MAG: hypothetical protein DWQ01_21915 [Planctomycetota bacterium]|nr:MAG: hypothetical protein DWQ01_21915 [Planctomycetota bacterium]
MLAFLRLLARALTGKLNAMEFALGAYFGVFLGLLPIGEMDPGTGWFGLNGFWLLTFFVFLLLRASLPAGLLFLALFHFLGRLFLDSVSFGLGHWLLEQGLPESLGRSLYLHLPAFQWHTYFGIGSMMLAMVLSPLLALASYRFFQKKIPQWRQRLADRKAVRSLSNSVTGRFLVWWLG